MLDFQAVVKQRSVLVQLILEAIWLQRQNKRFKESFERRLSCRVDPRHAAGGSLASKQVPPSLSFAHRLFSFGFIFR